jgi:SAM-dependent methyltransferase
MGAAAHLGIDLREYDDRIRTFIPGYEQLLEVSASVLATTVPARAPVVVDLGTGTGALAGRCLAAKPAARLFGVDEDEAMLAAAGRRLRRNFTALRGSFETVDLPACDAVTACLALHHIPTPARRLRLFRRIHRALGRGGVLIIADCYLSTDRRMQAFDRSLWVRHLERTYTRRQAAAYLRTWAKEDFYARLLDEIQHLERAGFSVDVAGRRGAFAVLVARIS